MTELAGLAGALALGCASGVVYFAALWATVRALPGARRPAVILFASLVLRLGLAAALFLSIVRIGGLPWTAAALAGFLLARTAIVRALRPSEAIPSRSAR